MTAIHAAGPWTYIKKPTQIGDVFKVGPETVVNSSHGAIILYDDHTSLNPFAAGVVEANARLIAAAPDLLAALEDAFAVLDDVESDRFNIDTDAVSLALGSARAAIARATGAAA